MNVTGDEEPACKLETEALIDKFYAYISLFIVLITISYPIVLLESLA